MQMTTEPLKNDWDTAHNMQAPVLVVEWRVGKVGDMRVACNSLCTWKTSAQVVGCADV